MKYRVQLVPEEEGGYSVGVPGLPGCYSQGATRADALANVREAIALYLEVADEIAREGESETVEVELKLA